MKPAAAAGVFCLLFASSAAAQDAPEKAPTPISVEADPPQIDLEEEEIEISGETAIDAANPDVRITAIAPSGRKYEWLVTADAASGAYSSALRFKFPSNVPKGAQANIEPGVWKVVARSPGGYGTAETTFRVTLTAEAPDEPWAQQAPPLARSAVDVAANLVTCMGNMPISPDRNQLSSILDRLRAHLAGGPDRVERELAAAMGTAKTLPDEFGHLEELLEPLDDALEEWGKEMKQRPTASARDNARCAWSQTPCEPADALAEDLNRVKEVLDLLKKPVDLITGYAGGPLAAAAKKKAVMPDLTPLHASLGQATRTLRGPTGLATWLTQAEALRAEVAAFVAKRLFDPYCQRFEGPFTVEFEANFRNQGGTLWWSYVMSLSGHLALRYPATLAGGKAALTGELVGCATRFRSWDDALRVGWPKLMAGALTFRTVKEPFHGQNLGAAGSACPAGFEIPVRGELTGETLTIELQPARRDFGKQLSQVRYMVISPLAGGLPATTSFELPYQDAFFVMQRATGNKPMTFPVRVVGKQLVIEHQGQTTSGSGGAKGVYKLNAKVCNPGCR